MNSPNIIEEIAAYISEHREDSDGDWEYMHTPYLKATLKELNQFECADLSK